MLVGKREFCDYQSIQAAVDELERDPLEKPVTLYIMSGVYQEAVRIYRSNLNIVGIGEVVITMNRHAKEPDESGEEQGTFATPTLFLGGRRLMLENLIIANTAGQGNDIGQAVAVSAHCDETLFRSCSFRGHQDTLFTGPLPPYTKDGKAFGGVPLKEQHAVCRQLYTNCYIEGTIDFIFGGAAAYFEHCEIRSLRHYNDGPGYITAASTPQHQEYGYLFNECYFTSDPGVSGVYLGRPWRGYARTDIVNCRLSGHIHPSGWDPWGNPGNMQTAIYREYGIAGDDPVRSRRAAWAFIPEEKEAAAGKERFFTGTDFWTMEGVEPSKR
ncbi:pectinesterase family protein [Paenibacillus sp. FSL H8-0259]|uniref:pectinesterase family protein n=1 Tax=Paenibacillus sp. FSL H8-0259 TaxID=1920423 RepID=UPI00096E9037|nr:pectinesterase family protein [Paenibacillus sp. FSL H8-0259]OMF25533.1 pectin methylesterase [Paenibacillus sp. FSL H8-0259]